MRAPETSRDALGPQDLVLVTAMPAIPVGSRVDRRRFLALKAEATPIFANSLALARELGAGLILTSGASFRTRGDEVADETWPIYRGGLAAIGTDTDPLIDEAMRTGSPPLALMMPGQIYGNGGMFRNFMYPMMKKGHSRIIGSGGNYIPRIHVDDCAAAYVQAVRRPAMNLVYRLTYLRSPSPCPKTQEMIHYHLYRTIIFSAANLICLRCGAVLRRGTKYETSFVILVPGPVHSCRPLYFDR